MVSIELIFNVVRYIFRLGVNIHGLYLDGCRWDSNSGMLAEAEKGQLFDAVPVIW